MNDQHPPPGDPTDRGDRAADDELVGDVLDGLAGPADVARVAADPDLSARLESFRRLRGSLLAEGGAAAAAGRSTDAVAAALAAADAVADPPAGPVPSDPTIQPSATRMSARRRRRAPVAGAVAAAAVVVLVLGAVAVGTRSRVDNDGAMGAATESADTAPRTTPTDAATVPPPAADREATGLAPDERSAAPAPAPPDLGDAATADELLARWITTAGTAATADAPDVRRQVTTSTVAAGAGDAGTVDGQVDGRVVCGLPVLATGSVAGRPAVVVAGPTVLDPASCLPAVTGP